MDQFAIEGLGASHWLMLGVAVQLVAIVAMSYILRRERSQILGLQRVAHKRGMRLVELMRLVSMAESSAKLGVWHYYPGEDRQEWSGGMKQLFGLERDTELLEGDAETLLASNEIDLVSHALEHSPGQDVCSSQIMIKRWDGSRRILQVETCHLGQGKGELDRILAVLADVTGRDQASARIDDVRGVEVQGTPSVDLAEPVDRRELMAKLDQHVIGFRKSRTPASLLLIEVSGGPEMRKIADEKLRSEFAAVAREHLRSNDVLGRLDRNEFAWLVAGADEHFAQLIAERMRCAFVIEGLGGFLGDHCLDIGVASARDGDTALSLFARADGALDRARKKSRQPLARVA